MYERPTTAFVAGFVGVSNVVERDGKRFAVRPEKIRMTDAGASPASGCAHAETGRIRDVVYAGMVTRYVVKLDGGGELQVVRLNLETTSAEALDAKGRRGSARVAPRAHARARRKRGKRKERDEDRSQAATSAGAQRAPGRGAGGCRGGLRLERE